MTNGNTPWTAAFGAALMVAALGANDAFAEERPTFPSERTQPVTCAEVEWNETMLEQHPRLVQGCREVIVNDGRKWARFETSFVRNRSDGLVEFEVMSRSGQPLERVVLKTAPGQVAYLDGRSVPFARLRQSDSINLYVPENQYGFAMQPAEASLVSVAAPAESPSSAPESRAASFAALEPAPAMLPATASVQPWLAAGGVFALLAALGLTMLRRRSSERTEAHQSLGKP